MLKEIKCEVNTDENDDDGGGRQEKKMHKGEDSLSSCSIYRGERASQGLGFRD
jgi:hypothetical protein